MSIGEALYREKMAELRAPDWRQLTEGVQAIWEATAQYQEREKAKTKRLVFRT